METKVAILGGCGHVGLPLAIALAQKDLNVIALDIDEEKIAKINSGQMPFIEEGAEGVLKSVLNSKKFSATNEPSCLSTADVVVVVVGTPVDEHLDPDPQAILSVLDSYKRFFRPNQLLILRSTVYPGVTRSIEEWNLRNSLNLKVAFCPERIAEGFAMTELYSLPQIVGARDGNVADEAASIFSHLTEKIIKVTPEEAELAKLFTNAWRYIKFSIANQFFMLSNNFGVDYENVRQAIAYEYPRASDLPKAGFAAGPCLLKDTMQLNSFSGNTFLLGHSAMLINEGLPAFIIDQIEKQFDLSRITVGLLGMTFKANIDDTRSSLSYKLRRILRFKAKAVLCSDPFILDPNFVDLNTVLTEADLIIIGTPHDQYKNLKFSKPVFDIWNMNGNGVLFNE